MIHGPYWYGWNQLGLPRAPGVYFLLRHKEVVYIGRSANLFARIRTHPLAKRIRSREFSVQYLEIPVADTYELEREWITTLKPPLNRHLYLGSQKRVAA